MITQTILSTTIFLIFAYLISLLFLYISQRSFIYKNYKKDLEDAKYYGYEAKTIQITTKDNITITSWYKKAKNNLPTMIYFHGNSGNLSNQVKKLKKFSSLGIGVLAISWRGFGTSSGSPSEKGLYLDGRAAVDYLLSQNISSKDIFLYGISLGTGIAVQIATEYPVMAVILESPYTSMTTLAKKRYPIFPIKSLLKDNFKTIDKISSIKSPLLIFHGYLDKTIPIEHSFKLLKIAKKPKKSFFFKQSHHDDLDIDILAKETFNFIVKKQYI